jgi:hypothetical protein
MIVLASSLLFGMASLAYLHSVRAVFFSWTSTGFLVACTRNCGVRHDSWVNRICFVSVRSRSPNAFCYEQNGRFSESLFLFDKDGR